MSGRLLRRAGSRLLQAKTLQTNGILNGHHISIFFITFIFPLCQSKSWSLTMNLKTYNERGDISPQSVVGDEFPSNKFSKYKRGNMLEVF